MKIVNNRSKSHKIMENKILIEFVIEYIKEKKLKNEVFDQINHIRLYKKIILLVELVRDQVLATTECYDRIEAESIIEQKINFPPILKLTLKVAQEQNKFKEQIKMKELHTIYDFKSRAESKMKISKCTQFYSYKEKDR